MTARTHASFPSTASSPVSSAPWAVFPIERSVGTFFRRLAFGQTGIYAIQCQHQTRFPFLGLSRFSDEFSGWEPGPLRQSHPTVVNPACNSVFFAWTVARTVDSFVSCVTPGRWRCMEDDSCTGRTAKRLKFLRP